MRQQGGPLRTTSGSAAANTKKTNSNQLRSMVTGPNRPQHPPPAQQQQQRPSSSTTGTLGAPRGPITATTPQQPRPPKVPRTSAAAPAAPRNCGYGSGTGGGGGVLGPPQNAEKAKGGGSGDVTIKWHKLCAHNADTEGPGGRVGHSLSVVGKSLYVIGGHVFESAPSGVYTHVVLPCDVHCLEITVQTVAWTKVTCVSPSEPSSLPKNSPRQPSPRYSHSATVVGDNIYLYGGYNTDCLSDCWCFNTRELSWTCIENSSSSSDSPGPRYAHTATSIGDGKILLFGGYQQSGFVNDVWILHTATCIWERKTCEGMAPQPRAHHSAVLSNNLLYIFGGRSSSGTYFSDLHALDIEKTKWSQMHIPPLPSAHAMNSDRPTTETKSNKVLHPPSDVSPTSSITGIAYHTAVPCDNVMVVYGGLDGKFCFNGPFILNLNKLVWERYQNSTEGENPIARHKHAAATIGRSGHCMILFGGFSVPPQLFDEIYLLNITLPETKVSEVLPKEKGVLPESSSLVVKQPQIVPPLESAPQRPLGQPSSVVPKTVPPAELPNPVPPGPKNVPSNTDPAQHGESTSKDVSVGSIPSIRPGSNETSAKDTTVIILQKQCLGLKEEILSFGEQLNHLTGRNLGNLTLDQLDQLEEIHREALYRISRAKRERMDLEILKAQKSSSSKMTTGNPNQTADLQVALTSAQNEILHLRRRLKEAGVEPVKKQQSLGVGFNDVKVLLFEPGVAADSVPTNGVAPLGLSDKLVETYTERIEGYERHRETERKGIVRLTEAQRQQLLTSAGISDSILNLSREEILQINQNRIQSLGSPTDNPLSEEQQQTYRQKFQQFFND